MESRLRNLKMVLTLAGLTLFLVFVIQNTEAVDVEFLFWSFQTRRALLLFIVLAIGFAIGWILHGWPRRERPDNDQAKKNREDA
jgi:uncharacterized integral membrane protein